jgi:hypothetical protein
MRETHAAIYADICAFLEVVPLKVYAVPSPDVAGAWAVRAVYPDGRFVTTEDFVWYPTRQVGFTGSAYRDLFKEIDRIDT